MQRFAVISVAALVLPLVGCRDDDLRKRVKELEEAKASQVYGHAHPRLNVSGLRSCERDTPEDRLTQRVLVDQVGVGNRCILENLHFRTKEVACPKEVDVVVKWRPLVGPRYDAGMVDVPPTRFTAKTLVHDDGSMFMAPLTFSCESANADEVWIVPVSSFVP